MIDPVTPFEGVLTHHEFQSSDFWYWGLPYTHVLGGWATASLFAPLLPDAFGFLGARAFNWLLSLPFGLALVLLARNFGVSRPWSLVAAAAVLFIPQVIFVFSSFNSDAFGLTIVALSALAFQSLERHPPPAKLLLFGIGCGLLLTVKLYFLPALIYFLCLYCVGLLTGSYSFSRRGAVILAAGIVIAAFPILLGTYLRFGEILGASGQFQFAELHRASPSARYGTCFLFCGGQLLHVDNLHWWLSTTFASFFAVLGWMNILIPAPFYEYVFPFAAISLFLLSVAWSARALIMRRGLIVAHPFFFWAMVAGTALMSLLSSQTTLPQPQGRYIFVVVPFIPLMIAALLSPDRLPAREQKG
ncbi:MAG: hypothetical protein DI629_16705 [Mesorhizobium amorphae]|nr:MAG: hypothetical protein DI629_16705 [Mesorhizobium amorphae]